MYLGGHRDHGGGKPKVKKDTWCAVTRPDHGDGRDWVQISGPPALGGGSMHPPGRSHVDDYDYPPWGDKGGWSHVLYIKKR